MTFVLKRVYVEPHVCFTPPQTENNPLVPGDIWRCDDCDKYWIWQPTYSSTSWWTISVHEKNKQIRRDRKGKPFKRYSMMMGPG